MQKDIDKTIQQIAERALSDSVVRLELWRPASYNDFVMSFKVENPTQYHWIESDNDSPYCIVEEYLSYASGFFIDKHRIVTNFHVAQRVRSIIAELVSKEEKFHIESVEAYDIESDLILLKVTGEGVPLTIGDSSKIMREEDICAAGYPNGNADITYGVFDGIVPSNQRIRMRIDTTDGSSGCPIFNFHGDTIGVDASGNEAYSYAIPSNTLLELIHKKAESISLTEWQKLPQIRALTEKKEGDKLQKKGEYRKAIAHYDTAIELNPDLVKAYQGRVDAKMEIGALGGAMEDLLIISRLQPVQFTFSNIKEYISGKIGWVRIMGIHLSIKLLRFILGRCGWFRFKGHTKSGRACREVKQGNKSKAKMLFREAIFDFTRSINIKPNVAGIYNCRGWTKCLLGKIEAEEANEEAERLFQEAISDIETALKLRTKKPTYKAPYLHTRAVAKAALGEHQQAIEDFDECIRLKPKKALFYRDRGLSLKELGQNAEADFAKAEELDPNVYNQL